MMQFKAFKPSGMEKIARSMGYQGGMDKFQDFLATNPAQQQQMNMYTNKAMQMAKGGMVKKFSDGGDSGAGDHHEPTFYRVPVGIPVDGMQESRKVYIGSRQDTTANRQAGSSDLASAVQDAGPGYLPTAYDAGAGTPVQQAPEEVPVEDTTPQGPTDLTGLYSDQLAENMPSNPQTYGTTFMPNNAPPLLNTAFVDNMGNVFVNRPIVQQAVAGQQTQGYATGGVVTNPTGTQTGTPTVTQPTVSEDGQPTIGQFTVEQMYQPGVPVGGTTIAAETPYDASQDIAADTGTLTGKIDTATELADTAQASMPTATGANLMQADTVAADVDAAISATQAAQANPQDPRAQITAAQQTTSSVSNLSAAQGNAFLINNPVQRQLQNGELISGTGVDAAKAAALTAQTQAAAATANPSAQAMVQDQLSGLMQSFQGANPPAWAAGAMRAATSAMAARGLGSSSLAGQAIVQAAMESALPIAMADAQTVAKFESQNLSNRQQSAMLAAEQRAKFMGQEFDQIFQAKVMNASKISDIANQNFTAEQQVQLENSRAANTMNLANLNNRQALVMAEASALAQLDTANLSNRQQTAVQNAQNFLQVDMANLSNRQQTELFKAQQRTQALFTDQAATNAAAQFNASSQNQVDQFFASLGSQVSQFNATQQNAQSQFNAGQTNTIARFNAELNNQRDQFNAGNQLVIAQANAQWRRQIATADTAAVNRANELNANAILDISKNAYDNLWNYYADTMEWAYLSANEELDRMNNIAIAELSASAQKNAAAASSSSSAGSALGSLIGTLGAAAITKWCWVAREVYGPQDYSWIVFRNWMFSKAPKWLYNLYGKHGEAFAEFISNKPLLKRAIKCIMDKVVQNHKMEYNRASN